MSYAGEMTPKQAWEILRENPDARLVDVRTQAEFAWVGSPDLSGIGRPVLQVEWITFPDMNPNPDFAAEVEAQVPDKGAPLIFICRSGVRSLHAAEVMTARGYKECYNLTGGFEGDKNDEGRRGTVNGWKVAGLPWLQY